MTDLALDYLGLDALLSEDERAWRDTVRAFVRDRIRPNIKTWYEQAIFPVELVPEMGRLGLLGAHLSGYGCPGRSAPVRRTSTPSRVPSSQGLVSHWSAVIVSRACA